MVVCAMAVSKKNEHTINIQKFAEREKEKLLKL